MCILTFHLPSVRVPLLEVRELDGIERAMYAHRGAPFLLERSILRRELSIRTGIPAAEVRLDYSPQGKPICHEQPFNLSHSGDILCIAFHHADVGVDIEFMRPRRHLVGIARRVMCPEQLDAWCSHGCPVEEFYSCWCAAEALAKLRGSSILRAREQPFLLNTSGIVPRFDNAPTVELFSPASGYAGAVATSPRDKNKTFAHY